ncbi:MAG TPA: formyltetrahydrofolate deformylase [Burkholderiaceae bacterium]|nr:formyltetrahydrofolate deformylase [Burkholderiaceae bacterium]
MLAEPTLTLTISCPDKVGIVAAVSRFIADRGGWIVEANHHADPATQRFFMRNVLLADSVTAQGVTAAQLRTEFAPIAADFDMQWALVESAQRKRVVILVSRHEHCLIDLLYRWRAGELAGDIVAVISNHVELRRDVEWHGVPFHHVPVPADPAGKAAAFAAIERLYRDAGGDVMVLARFMQILPAALCEKLAGRVINIHHSFLPSFAGGRPYRQAFDRGVKLIGATSHYATAELDDGPIIEQDVVRIDHGDTESDLMRYGRDIEKVVLARALKYHLEDRVFLNGRRTVVFR